MQTIINFDLIQAPEDPVEPVEPTEEVEDPCNPAQTPINASEACNMLATAEGNGKYDQGGSASGRYQFVKKTGVSVLKQLGYSNPESTWNECSNSASENCRRVQDNMCNFYSEDISRQLKSKGIPITTENMYLAWNQGAGGANAILKSRQTGQPVTNKQILKNMHGQAWEYSSDGTTFYNNMRGYLKEKKVPLA